MTQQPESKLKHKRNLSLQQITFHGPALKDRSTHCTPIHSGENSRVDQESGTVAGGETLSSAKKNPDSKARLKQFVGHFEAEKAVSKKSKIGFSPFLKTQHSSHLKDQTVNDSIVTTPPKPRRMHGLENHLMQNYHAVRNQRMSQLDLEHKKVDSSSFSKLRDIE